MKKYFRPMDQRLLYSYMYSLHWKKLRHLTQNVSSLFDLIHPARRKTQLACNNKLNDIPLRFQSFQGRMIGCPNWVAVVAVVERGELVAVAA